MAAFETASAMALVTKAPAAGPKGGYLLMSSTGAPQWVDDPGAATAFPSMREATRAAMRLPSHVRAYGLPRDPELSLHNTH
jgi:hypothetical protein